MAKKDHKQRYGSQIPAPLSLKAAASTASASVLVAEDEAAERPASAFGSLGQEAEEIRPLPPPSSPEASLRALVRRHEEAEQALAALGPFGHETPKLEPLAEEIRAELARTPENAREFSERLQDLEDLIAKLRAWWGSAQETCGRLRSIEEKKSARLKDVEEERERLSVQARRLKADQDELKADHEAAGILRSQLAERETRLEARELNARLGFGKEREDSLSELKQEILDFESRREESRRRIEREERERGEVFYKREEEIRRKEEAAELRRKELDKKRQRLDSDERRLDQEREEIARDAREEADREIKRLEAARDEERTSLIKAWDDRDELRTKLESHRRFSELLAGRSPEDWEEERRALKRRCEELEEAAARARHEGGAVENAALRKTCEDLQAKLEETTAQLNADQSQLATLRQGVGAKQTLEQEKRALEKNNQLLSARLNQLAGDVEDLTRKQQAAHPFPEMSRLDADAEEREEAIRTGEPQAKPQLIPELRDFVEDLRHRIAQAEGAAELYFRSEDVRIFLAGLAMSRLHILQGVSGTGKTSLAKAFAKAVDGHCTDIAVQAGWRDRDDLLGHYNAFEKRFYERDCLQGLYRAQTRPFEDRVNIILLDEMNLSRPEQYFAEFLSALEKNDPQDRLVSLSESALPQAPKLLVEGRKLRVPENVWFIGTANHDETTNEFADKTYDRAHVMTLPRHEEVFRIQKKTPARYSRRSLEQRFQKAVEDHGEEVGAALDLLAGGELSGVLRQRFGFGWGNRFERQAKRFLPVFMAAGGALGDGLDHLLASRVFRRGKVTARYDAGVEDLREVERALEDLWTAGGWSTLPELSMELLEGDLRKKERGA
ncbi:AAA family ATPase [Neomegalonema perideroedes]|uniref:AAA family ATPase n=1 Tax=Neomegalonema perideroedes TaxID=217219 RepID=UPI0003695CE7|nr:AAA family ATPase [Neomegalonema perideroedes]